MDSSTTPGQTTMPRISTAPPKESIWSIALQTLPAKDRESLDTLTNSNNIGVLADIIQAAQLKRAEALQKRWKFNWKGQTHVVRDHLEKIIAWVEKFKAVGDAAVQYDPAHAALPWACIRFFLQVAVDNVKTFGIMAENMGQISNLVAQCAIVEDLYLTRGLKVTQSLEDSLAHLYARILAFLARAIKYYSNSTMKNLAGSFLADAEAAQSFSSTVSVEQGGVDRCVMVAEGEIRELDATKSDQVSLQRVTCLKNILESLKSPITRINADVSQLLVLAQETDRLTILKSISTLPYPSHHQAAARGRLEGSGQWLLHHPSFINWRGSSSSTIFWLHGIPGCGKTKLCSVVIDDIKATETDLPELLAFFYCARDPREPRRGQCVSVMQSLLRQVTALSPTRRISQPVKVRHDRIQEEGFGDREWTEDECVETLIEVMDIYPSLTIFIDALDECGSDERMSVLQCLKRVREESANLVKIFITSRDDIDIMASLADASDIRVSATYNSDDISRFVDEKVDVMMDSRARVYGPGSQELRNEVRATLSSKAQGMFRWVDLQIETLKHSKLDQDLKSRLGHLPQTLDHSYYTIYATIIDAGPSAKRLADGVFKWLLYGRKTLQTDSFAAFISCVTGTSDIPLSSQHLLDVCGNLVEIDQSMDVFRFVHLSVREFFEQFHNCRNETFTPQKAHASLAYHSLLHICLTLSPDGSYIDSSQGNRRYAITSKLCSDIAVKRYADRYWHEHASLAGDERRVDPFQGLFMAFIRKRPDIGSIFERWSWDALFDDISGLELERCHSATRKPNHVIWLACAFDLDDVVDMCCHQEGFNLEMMTGVSLTPLLEASRLGSCRTLSRLIEKGADVWARTPRYKKGALDFGVDNNHPDVVKKLADYGLTQSSLLATTEDSTPSSAVCFLAQDDIYIKREVSTRSVDFLTYEWKGDELMASWRHAASTSCEFENRERLANASWRTWSKVYHKTEEVPPSSVNWLKDHDVTWLYGPLQREYEEASYMYYNSSSNSKKSNVNSILKRKSRAAAFVSRASSRVSREPVPIRSTDPVQVDSSGQISYDRRARTVCSASSMRCHHGSDHSKSAGSNSMKAIYGIRHVRFSDVISQMEDSGSGACVEEDYDDSSGSDSD